MARYLVTVEIEYEADGREEAMDDIDEALHTLWGNRAWVSSAIETEQARG